MSAKTDGAAVADHYGVTNYIESGSEIDTSDDYELV